MLKALQERILAQNEAAKCSQIWNHDPTSARPLSRMILEPIREALRKARRGGAFLKPGGDPLTDEEMTIFFKDGVADLQRQLGRLLLNAVLTHDDQFKEQVDDAVKDADALFYRGTSEGGSINERFCDWSDIVPVSEWRAMTITEIREQFQNSFRELSGIEWAGIKEAFQLQNVARKRSGRPSKKASR